MCLQASTRALMNLDLSQKEISKLQHHLASSNQIDKAMGKLAVSSQLRIAGAILHEAVPRQCSKLHRC